jgi:hypothetical protein
VIIQYSLTLTQTLWWCVPWPRLELGPKVMFTLGFA